MQLSSKHSTLSRSPSAPVLFGGDLLRSENSLGSILSGPRSLEINTAVKSSSSCRSLSRRTTVASPSPHATLRINTSLSPKAGPWSLGLDSSLSEVSANTKALFPHIKAKGKKVEILGGLKLNPEPPTFGLVCQGYRYRLTIKVVNVGTTPERMRVLCSKSTFPKYAKPADKDAKAIILSKNEDYKLLNNLKSRLTAEGSSYMHIARKFKSMDLDGNGTVDFEEFQHALAKMEMMLSHDKELRLFRYFDKNGGGDIDIDEFLAGIREPLHIERVPENKIKCTYLPVRLAPGISTNIVLELSAEVPGISECELRIMEASTQTEIRRTIKATVLTMEQFKTVGKELEMATPDLEAEGTFSLLSQGVTEIGRVLTNEEFGESGLRNAKETNLNEEEVKEIFNELPIVHGTYYHPSKKELRFEPSFMKVVVDPDFSIQECENEAIALCKDKFFELESKGMFTSEVLEKMRYSGSM